MMIEVVEILTPKYLQMLYRSWFYQAGSRLKPKCWKISNCSKTCNIAATGLKFCNKQWGSKPWTCLIKSVTGSEALCHHWFKKWLGYIALPIHCLKQYLNFMKFECQNIILLYMSDCGWIHDKYRCSICRCKTGIFLRPHFLDLKQ